MNKEIQIPSIYGGSEISLKLTFNPLVNHNPCTESIILSKRLNLSRKWTDCYKMSCIILPSIKVHSWGNQFSTVKFTSVAQSCMTLQPHESQHARPPCPTSTPGVHSDSRPSSQWCHPAISSSVVHFSSCPQSLPASESFPMTQLFTWGGQSTGVSALESFLPKNTQDWSPLEWTGWISLQSEGLSRVFSNPTVQKHQFFGAQLSSQSNSHIHTWPLEKPKPWLAGPLLAK